MNFFSQRRLGQRLAWGFGTVLALLLGIAALSLIGMQNLNRTLQEVVIQGGIARRRSLAWSEAPIDSCLRCATFVAPNCPTARR